jgi:hypothetical protein
MDDDALTPIELRTALRLAESTYFKYQRLGLLDRFRLVPRIGPPRYSRKALRAYLDREPVPYVGPRMLARR